MALLLNFTKPLNTVAKFKNDYVEKALNLKVQPLRIPTRRCSSICKCDVCQKKKPTPSAQLTARSSLSTRRWTRRFSIQGFHDDFLFICSHLQKTDIVCQSINVNIHETLFLKDRDLNMLVYYDATQGLQFVKNKAILVDVERFFMERKAQFQLNQEIEKIKAGQHPKYELKEFHEMNNIVMQRLKSDIQHNQRNANLVCARYQTGDQIILTQFELHQMLTLSKSNPVFDSLVHLQLYLYDEQEGALNPSLEGRNPKDLRLYHYQYTLNRKLFEEIVSEFSTLVTTHSRGQYLWGEEKKYSDGLTLDSYFEYTAHKIAAYIECFHEKAIEAMEVLYLQNGPDNVSIVSVRKLKWVPAEKREWKIRSTRVQSVADKIRANDMGIMNYEDHPMTERARTISSKLSEHTQRVLEKVAPITNRVTEEMDREHRSEEAFQILQPKGVGSLSRILQKGDYAKLLGNFPKQLARFKFQNKSRLWKKRSQEEEDNRPLCLEDYLVKGIKKPREANEISSRFQRSISRKFFRSIY